MADAWQGLCGASIDGPTVTKGVSRARPLFRRQCKSWPLKGYDHCRHHLTPEERERWREARRG